MPKRGTLKYKKYHKSSINKISAIRLQCCPDIAITEVILKEPVRMTMKHVNAIRKTIRRLVKKQGRLHRVITSF
jgi:ribosomal protein L16/L10AE